MLTFSGKVFLTSVKIFIKYQFSYISNAPAPEMILFGPYQKPGPDRKGLTFPACCGNQFDTMHGAEQMLYAASHKQISASAVRAISAAAAAVACPTSARCLTGGM